MDIETRRAALAAVLEGFTVAHDKVLEAYGLRLPKHLAYALGWWQGLSTAERVDYADVFGAGPIGIGAWLCEGHYDRAPTLAREDRDPPELVSVFADRHDGRWALWYNDPSELPRMIVQARPDEISVCQSTLLETIADETFLGQDDLAELQETIDADPVLHAVIDWRDEVEVLERAAYKAEAIAPCPDRLINNVVEPWIEGWEPPSALFSLRQLSNVDELVATARDKLATEPGWALVVGHALHSRGDTAGTELLVAAYGVLGRGALRAIVDK
jgi:hypothetical protein